MTKQQKLQDKGDTPRPACTVCAGAGEIEGTGGGMRPCPQCVGELGPVSPPDDDDE